MAEVTNRSTTLASAPPSGLDLVEMLRISSEYSARACPPLACSRRSGVRSADVVTSLCSAATERIRLRKNVLPAPYSPMTKRMADPPSAILRTSSVMAAISADRPTWMCWNPILGTTPDRSALR